MNKDEIIKINFARFHSRNIFPPLGNILSNMGFGGETVLLQFPPGDLDELIFAGEEYNESEK